MTRIIAVHSYRGGTGKSHLTANLAAQLAVQGRRVAVVDTDLPSPGIHNLFGLAPGDVDKTLNHFLWGLAGIDEVCCEVGTRLGVRPPGRLWLVPSSVRADDIARILKDGFDVRTLHDGLRALSARLGLDVLFIDTHPGLSKETFLSIAMADLVVLVLRPDKQDFQGTAVTVDVARELRVNDMLLAINKVHGKLDPEALRERVEQAYRLPVGAVFPLSEEVAQLASEGVFSLERPDHPITREIVRLAARVMSH